MKVVDLGLKKFKGDQKQFKWNAVSVFKVFDGVFLTLHVETHCIL